MKLILVRGLPGSGKSTIAKNLIGWYWHLETDQFWMKDGQYRFNPAMLDVAHEWCQSETRKLLTRGFSPIVSNTFTTKKELRPYFDIAKEFGIVPQVILCQAQYGSVHDVPEKTIQRMKDRFEYNIDDLYEEYEIFN